VSNPNTIADRRRALLLVCAVILYYAAANWLTTRIAFALANGAWFSIVMRGLLLVLMLAGLQIAARFWKTSGSEEVYPAPTSPLGWRWSAVSPAQLGSGLALGWGIAVALVLPLVIAGGLQLTFDWSGAAWGQLALILLATLLSAALRQTVLSGFALRRLTDASGPTVAVVFTSLFAGLVMFRDVGPDWRALLTVVLFQSLCCFAALRSGSLWLGLGVDFSARIFLGSVFGFPVLGSAQYSANVLANTAAPAWLSGDVNGPAGGAFAPLVLILAIIVVFVLTHVDIIASIRPGGVPVRVIERHAPVFPAEPLPPAAGSSLVQIGAPAPPEIPLPSRPE
jgi:hypothetical protein